MMTAEERDAKEAIVDELYESGYGPYARLVQLCQINLTRDPDCVAYMVPGRATIVVNANLRIDQVSTIIRHEILHEFLTHQIRALKYLGVDPDELTVDKAQDYIDDLYNKKVSSSDHQLFNIAGDYEISNLGYTTRDKGIIKAIDLGDGRLLKGLVTDFDHPGWEDLTFEELLDKLKQELPPQPQQPKNGSGEDGDQSDSDDGDGENGDSNLSDDFVRGWNKAVADFKAGRLKL